MINTQRAEHALKALDYYHEQKDGDKLAQEDIEGVIVDLLADFMHLADQADYDFDSLLLIAAQHFHDETIGL